MKTYDFPVTLSCPLHTTYRGTGNTKEEALANALLTGNVVDSWAAQNDADFPDTSDFNLEEASEIKND